MNCPTCGAAAEPKQRFCADCGTLLERACAGCGLPLPGQARFCPSCGAPAEGPGAPAAAAGLGAMPGAGEAGRDAPGTPLGAAAGSGRAARDPLDQASLGGGTVGSAGPQAERRLVSVLFCDLVGFTGASEARDAEQTRELLSSYYELARERVERYGGSIEKSIGDAVMAVWGVPVAHEDDAERAVRAALDLVGAVPGVDVGLAARAAVVSGEAAVTLGAEGQGMVAGDLVNTASRLQGHAEAGSVLVSDATRRATERAVIYESAGSASLKGKSVPIEAWRAVRLRLGIGGRLPRSRQGRMPTPRRRTGGSSRPPSGCSCAVASARRRPSPGPRLARTSCRCRP
jgi:class 3 adenylate cyclase